MPARMSRPSSREWNDSGRHSNDSGNSGMGGDHPDPRHPHQVPRPPRGTATGVRHMRHVRWTGQPVEPEQGSLPRLRPEDRATGHPRDHVPQRTMEPARRRPARFPVRLRDTPHRAARSPPRVRQDRQGTLGRGHLPCLSSHTDGHVSAGPALPVRGDARLRHLQMAKRGGGMISLIVRFDPSSRCREGRQHDRDPRAGIRVRNDAGRGRSGPGRRGKTLCQRASSVDAAATASGGSRAVRLLPIRRGR